MPDPISLYPALVKQQVYPPTPVAQIGVTASGTPSVAVAVSTSGVAVAVTPTSILVGG